MRLVLLALAAAAAQVTYPSSGGEKQIQEAMVRAGTPRVRPTDKPPDPLVLASWINSGADASQHDASEVMPEDYLWQKLEGRCCFHGSWTPPKPGTREKPKWVSVGSCSECSVWGQPDASCHRGPAECALCGMGLYCEGSPPPLLGGAQVCVGASRVGEGCYDHLRMGVCLTKTLQDCLAACQRNPDCENFVYYSREMKGSCVLCSDLVNTEPTERETTRVYEVVPAPPSPSPPLLPNQKAQRSQHFSVFDTPAPPPSPPLPPPPPPVALDRLGFDSGASTHFECKFEFDTEYAVEAADGYTNARAGTRLECCNKCGLQTGCQDFVYQAATGLCLLLPSVKTDELVKVPQPGVVSGSLQVFAVTAERPSLHQGVCEFRPSSGWSDGLLGQVSQLREQKPITSRQDCCDACFEDEWCTKFSFAPETAECRLYEPYAEAYTTTGLISGILKDRYQADGGSTAGGYAKPAQVARASDGRTSASGAAGGAEGADGGSTRYPSAGLGSAGLAEEHPLSYDTEGAAGGRFSAYILA
jgi:hypothetical protein